MAYTCYYCVQTQWRDATEGLEKEEEFPRDATGVLDVVLEGEPNTDLESLSETSILEL